VDTAVSPGVFKLPRETVNKSWRVNMADLRAPFPVWPFVPSGSDYEASRQLFADLGFEEVWENSGYAGFRNGRCTVLFFKTSMTKSLRAISWFASTCRTLTPGGPQCPELQLGMKYPGISELTPPVNFPWGPRS